jgi:quercetin dioxygenase-like cupin family protein
MTGIRRTALLVHPIRVTADRDTYRVELPPGLHTHPGPATGSVERGRIAFGRDGQPVQELHLGDAFFEAAGEAIRRFDNLYDAEPATFIAFYLLSGDQPLIQPIH